ncbi:MAG: Sec-independent protein translocase protein TatB [Pseudomonadota bacterium]
MFDIGFWELVIMALIALVIVGPERLPALAQDTARLFKKFRHFIQNAKREVEKELELDQLNNLSESINHVEGLMQEAPDRFMQEEANKPETNSSK